VREGLGSFATGQDMYVIALLLLLHVLPDSRSGSIAVTSVSDDRLIVAADSRATDDNGHRIDDLECKIHMVGKNLILIPLGKAHFGNVLDGADLAHKIYSANPNANTEKIATLWGQQMQSGLEMIGKRSQKTLLGGLQKDDVVLALGIFAGADANGKISAYQSVIKYKVDGNKIILSNDTETLPQGTTTVFFHGRSEAQEFLSGKTKRAYDRNIELMEELESKHITDYVPYRLIAAVEAAIAWANDEAIGGNVDALILYKGGKIEWLQRKNNCYNK
jgi:hypothetical protein